MIPRRSRNLVFKFSFFCLIVYALFTLKGEASEPDDEDYDAGSLKLGEAIINEGEESKIKDPNMVLGPANVQNDNKILDVKPNEKDIQKKKEVIDNSENKINKIEEAPPNNENDRVKEKEEKDKADEAQNCAILPAWRNGQTLQSRQRKGG